MTIFWLGVAAMSIIASLLLVWPIWRGRVRKAVVEQDQLNVAIFEDRMKELDAELAGGVLTEERYEQARNELQRDLLQNTGTNSRRAAAGGGGSASCAGCSCARCCPIPDGCAAPPRCCASTSEWGCRAWCSGSPSCPLACGPWRLCSHLSSRPTT